MEKKNKKNTTTNHDKGEEEKRCKEKTTATTQHTHNNSLLRLREGYDGQTQIKKKFRTTKTNDGGAINNNQPRRKTRRWRCGDYWKASDRVPHTHNNKPWGDLGQKEMRSNDATDLAIEIRRWNDTILKQKKKLERKETRKKYKEGTSVYRNFNPFVDEGKFPDIFLFFCSRTS